VIQDGSNPPARDYAEGALIVVHAGVVDVEEKHNAKVPSAFSLSQNYPNPFNATTEISFSVPVQSHVRIAIYNLFGQLVCELTDGDYEPGVHHVKWNGTDGANAPVSSGVYFYRMTTDSSAGTVTRKMLLLR